MTFRRPGSAAVSGRVSWTFTDEAARHPSYTHAEMTHGTVYYREISGGENAIRTDSLFHPVCARNAGILP